MRTRQIPSDIYLIRISTRHFRTSTLVFQSLRLCVESKVLKTKVAVLISTPYVHAIYIYTYALWHVESCEALGFHVQMTGWIFLFGLLKVCRHEGQTAFVCCNNCIMA